MAILCVKRAGDCQCSVSLGSLYKAVKFAGSFNVLQIRSLSLSDMEKDEKTRVETIRLKEVEVRVEGLLEYFGWLQKPEPAQ